MASRATAAAPSLKSSSAKPPAASPPRWRERPAAPRTCPPRTGPLHAAGQLRRYERNADHFLAFTGIACTLIYYRRLAK
ncbi:hypothetical protein ACFYPA_29125 [Streptomyces sp. NPDC005775]|uniref:hypothetical protein n=1 Tax=Streptomyces sp. NPDC005775 TaxID=3364729 RepID=UPI00368245A8